MKKVIEGKVYNTDTATEICDISGPYGDDRGNFRWNSTSLYRTPKGRWFIAGQGNGLSRWASYNGNTYSWGRGLCAIDEEEARELAERYGNAETVERYFTCEEA